MDGEAGNLGCKVSFLSHFLQAKGREQMVLDCLYHRLQEDCLICATLQRVGSRMGDERQGLH